MYMWRHNISHSFLQQAEHWEKTDADTERQRQAAAAVSIQKIFRGYVDRKAYLRLKKSYREDQENKRLSAVTIQRWVVVVCIKCDSIVHFWNIGLHMLLWFKLAHWTKNGGRCQSCPTFWTVWLRSVFYDSELAQNHAQAGISVLPFTLNGITSWLAKTLSSSCHIFPFFLLFPKFIL